VACGELADANAAGAQYNAAQAQYDAGGKEVTVIIDTIPD
jgi:hypothetical protein